MMLWYAEQADEQADDCDDSDEASHPPSLDPQVPTPPGKLNDIARRNRSAGTLYLASVRLALLGELERCRVTGLPMKFVGATCDKRDPLRASRAAHLKHGFPLDYGFTTPWPTSLRQFDGRRWNVSVESWFENCWLRKHRPAALAARTFTRIDEKGIKSSRNEPLGTRIYPTTAPLSCRNALEMPHL